MGEKEQAAASAAVPDSSPAKTIRVFMGGVSGSVTAADVEKTFASLGRVDRVEFLRTNSRSFAFMDFKPNSEKSLSKLFATYNGCVWKGAKLRVEKAKEHYLDRLQREWAEDAELENSTVVDLDTNKSITSSEKIKSLTREKKHLQIFFPKLKKVKPLPYSGTGKHKYSFQRVEVPSLPVHFCDCEEHSNPSEAASHKNLCNPTGGMNKVELNIMHCVMNKIFEKEATADTTVEGTSLATDANFQDKSIYDAQSDEREPVQETDVDNLVTNFGVQGTNDILDFMQAKGWEMTSVDQESRLDKNHASRKQLTQKKHTSQKRQKNGPKSTAEVVLHKESHSPQIDAEESPSILAATRESSEAQPQEVKGFTVTPIETQMKQNPATDQSTKSTSWVQKSSWRELVGDAGHSSFSISHILPTTDPTPRDLIKDAVPVDPNAVGKGRVQSSEGRSEALAVKQAILSVAKADTPIHGETLVKKQGIPAADLAGNKNAAPGRKDKTAMGATGVAGVCTFMRSASSEKEWTKARTALSGYLKRKSSGKDATKSLKRRTINQQFK